MAVKTTKSGVSREYLFNSLPDVGVRHATIWGTSVTLLTQIARQAISLAGTIVVARYLAPADFGLVAMVVAPLAIIEVVREFGLMNICVQAPVLDHDRVNALFWFNAVAGIVGGVGVILCAPLLAAFYSLPDIVPVANVLATGLIIVSFSIQHYGLLRRNMQFGTLALLETLSTAVSVALGILAAQAGWGYRAILVQIISARFMSAAGVWVLCAWRPTFSWKIMGVRDLLSNGAHLTGSSLVSVVARSLDAIVLARVAGAHSVGIYTRGIAICMLPGGLVEGPLSAISVSVLSRLRDKPDRGMKAVQQFLRILTTVMAGMALALGLGPELIVSVILGKQWLAVAVLVPPLALLSIALSLANAATVLATVYGALSSLLRYTSGGAIFLAVMVVWGAVGGMMRLAVAYAVTMLVTSGLSLFLIGRQIFPHTRMIQRTVLPPVAVALAIWAGVTFMVAYWSLSMIMASVVRLLIGGALYSAWIYWYVIYHGKAWLFFFVSAKPLRVEKAGSSCA